MHSGADVRGLAHITGDGLNNLLRLSRVVGYEIDDPLPVPPLFDLVAERGGVSAAEMYGVFNMGCGFCCVVAASDTERALEILRRHHPAATRIGCVIDDPGAIRHPATASSGGADAAAAGMG
jgi:phosphoribosylformylglycinamidine cyclo-ligase